MQVPVLAHRGLRIGNKEIECLIQNLLLLASLKKMLTIASCMYCLNKEISIAFNIISISFKCACNCGVIFYRNSPERPAVRASY